MDMNALRDIETVARRYRYTWLMFGATFLIISYNLAGRNGTLNIAYPVLLVLLYSVAGNLVGFWVGWVGQKVVAVIPEAFEMAHFSLTIKAGLFSSTASFLLHLALILWIRSLDPSSPLAQRVPDFHSSWITVLGAAVFPFLACIAAAATLKRV